MDASTVNIWIMIGTLLTAVGTLLLAAIAWIAARIALRDLRHASDQLRLSAENAAVSAENLEFQMLLSKRRIERQRAEVTHAAISRFSKLYYRNRNIMLNEVKRIIEQYESDTGKRPDPSPKISDLFTRERLKRGATPKEVTNALQSTLNCLEEIGVGVSLGVYDKHVVYHLVNDIVRSCSTLSESYISLIHEGNLPGTAKQPSAYEMFLLLSKILSDLEKKGDVPKLLGALED